MLKLFFSAVYFIAFGYAIDFVFRNTIGLAANLLVIFCWSIALIISVGLAEYTVKKIKR